MYYNHIQYVRYKFYNWNGIKSISNYEHRSKYPLGISNNFHLPIMWSDHKQGINLGRCSQDSLNRYTPQ